MENTKTAIEIQKEILFDGPEWEIGNVEERVSKCMQVWSDQENNTLKKRIEELEAETILYGVSNFSWDGGGSNKSLYRTLEEARKELLLCVENAQKETNLVYENNPEDAPKKWHEIDEDLWTDGMDNIVIQRYRLNPSTNGK